MDLADFIRMPRIPNVQLADGPGLTDLVRGELFLSSHHLIFHSEHKEIQILYNNIDSTERKALPGKGVLTFLRCKNTQPVWLLLLNDDYYNALMYTVDNLAMPPSMDWLFSFSFQPRFASDEETLMNTVDFWNLFDCKEEFERMGLPSAQWRITDINAKLEFCPSYPTHLAVPKDVEDSILQDIAKFRDRRRIPVVSFFHKQNKVPLIRCSQPLVGNGKRLYEDERMFRSILDACPKTVTRGLIVDARATAEVTADKGRGGGTEDSKFYFNWNVVNGSMADPRSLYESFLKHVDAVQDSGTSSYLSKLEAAGWAKSVQTAISTSVVVAYNLHRESIPVAVHDNTGLDRPIVICSLAQIMLDPYFRTIHGFSMLIEKEWLECGHPFSRRNAHFGDRSARSRDRSPVFLLFLECVWQIMLQFPCAFEFNENFLIALFDLSVACQYGTFLGDDAKEREAAKLSDRTTSVWAFFAQRAERRRIENPLYEPLDDWIRPSFRPQNIAVWLRCYGRFTFAQAQHDEAEQLLHFLADQRKAVRAEFASLLKELEGGDEPGLEDGPHPARSSVSAGNDDNDEANEGDVPETMVGPGEQLVAASANGGASVSSTPRQSASQAPGPSSEILAALAAESPGPTSEKKLVDL